jgi:hypothetical protein
MITAREKILVEGQHDWVKLWQIHGHVSRENLSASLAEVQRKTLDLVRAMVTEGVAEVGDLRDHGARFEAWDAPLDESIQRLSAEYVDRFDDRTGWPWTLWLRITEKGKALSCSYEPEYETWLEDLRAHNREYDALPLTLEPDGAGRGA